jgi:RNA polymerase sigma-70 factor (ECF subfamily)
MSGISGVLAFPRPGLGVRISENVERRDLSQEQELIRRLQQGDELAFRELVERYQSKVHSIIYGILRNRNDAEDIAQQVFTKIYFSIGNFDGRSALLTWIYKITLNECYDYLRKRRVRKLVYESDVSDEEELKITRSLAAADATQTIEENLARRDYVLKLLARVSEEDRNLLMLKEVEGHSVDELAEMTGMNQNTIKVKLFRARQKLVKAARRLAKPPALGMDLPGAYK